MRCVLFVAFIVWIEVQKNKNVRNSKKNWGLSDSNQGPIDLQSNALPAAPSPRDGRFAEEFVFKHFKKNVEI